jgi:cytochrome c oxidase subunit III
MQVGTLETEVEQEKPRRRRSRISGGGPGGRGGRNGGGDNSGGGGGNGGSGGDRAPNTEFDDVNRDKSRVITWFLLLVVMMTFGGLIGSYIYISTIKALEWKPFDLPIQVWISTAIILASSVTYEIARKAVNANDHLRSKRFLLTTTVLGGVFISSQIIAWLALVNRGLYMRGNPYAGFFYILTAAHAIHVLGGLVAMGSIVLRNWYPTEHSDEIKYRKNFARSVGWYWHFMGALWIVLVILLGFWK